MVNQASLAGQAEVDTMVDVPKDGTGLPSRRHLPTRRGGYNQRFTVGAQTVYLRTGEYEDGRLGEIWIDVSRTGTTLRAMFNALAMAVSRALQYGVPLQEFIDAFKDFRFEPCGEVTGDSRINEASSILDYIFRELELTYVCNTYPESPEPDDACSSETPG